MTSLVLCDLASYALSRAAPVRPSASDSKIEVGGAKYISVPADCFVETITDFIVDGKDPWRSSLAVSAIARGLRVLVTLDDVV